MTITLLECEGGRVVLPDPSLVLVDRADGGNLIVNPPREVWERSELTPRELMLWSFLVAATGKSMLDVLPQLDGGCINYWEAGNWALNAEADPRGRKRAREHRRVHLHLLGHSPNAVSDSWQWGEAPKFPDFAERKTWAAKNQRLTPSECESIVLTLVHILTERYELDAASMKTAPPCEACRYPKRDGHVCE